MGHLFRSAHQHTCILLLTNELKPGSDKLQGYSCELQRVTPTVRSMALIIIDFNGSHKHPVFFPSSVLKWNFLVYFNQNSSGNNK
jgi:hypothetical protein